MQTVAEPIGPTVDAIRAALKWLGGCQRQQAGHSMHLIFKFAPEETPQTPLKLKIEINTREHSNLLGLRAYPFTMDNEAYGGKAEILSFEPEELFATKLRALLQRRKNRDLFDLSVGLDTLALDTDKILTCFVHYLRQEGKSISRAIAEQRMVEKLAHSLSEDVAPLLPVGVRFDEKAAQNAFEHVWTALIVRLPGEPWKLTADAFARLRGSRPGLLQALS